MQSHPTSPDSTSTPVQPPLATVIATWLILGVKCNGDGDTPLHVALKFEGAYPPPHRREAPVDTQTNAGDLPINLVAESGKVHVIEMLGVVADPCAWDIYGNGLRPIHVTYIHSHMDAVKVLVEDGAADRTCDAYCINLRQLWAVSQNCL
ncbi:hypothetical protein HK405_001348 [Cladochytrium tenue]|nr:hypothetical protein HK405_001348 [Cladochytrium tenue]